jgi:surface antigen
VKNAQQYRADTGAVIPPSGTIPAGVGLFLDCAPTDTTGAKVQMQVELQKLPARWTGNPNHVSSFVASGSRAGTSVPAGLAAGNYGWRYRVVNSAGVTGNWVPENNPDFIVQAVYTPVRATSPSIPPKPKPTYTPPQPTYTPEPAADPSISRVSPASLTPMNGNQPLTIRGNNFQNGATLSFIPPDSSTIKSSAAKLTFVSANQIKYQINTENAVGTWTVQVNNPDGQSSPPVRFKVEAIAQPPPEQPVPSPSATVSTPYNRNVQPNSIPSGQPDLLSSYYTTDNVFWQNGFAPASTRPPNPHGYPLDNALGNCTWYAYGRMLELGYTKAQLTCFRGNAKEWAAAAAVAGIPTDSIPSVGAIAQSVRNNHVAVVEGISGNMVTISESAYYIDIRNETGSYLWKKTNVLSTVFENYIHVSNGSPKTRLSKPIISTLPIPEPVKRPYNPDVPVTSRAGQAPTVNTIAAAPFIRNVSPPSLLPMNGTQPLTISGNNFQDGATLSFVPPGGGAIISYAAKLRFVSANQINYQINNLSTVGAWTVQVVNPDGQSSSPPVSFKVEAIAQVAPTQPVPSPLVTVHTPYIRNVPPTPIPSGQNDWWLRECYTTRNIFWNDGWAPAITMPPSNKLKGALGNCTWYAYGRMLELGYTEAQLQSFYGDADKWPAQDRVALAAAAGIKIYSDSIPSVGAIAQQSVKYHHVAIVEGVSGDMVTISQSSFYTNEISKTGDYLLTNKTVKASVFDNYIHVSNYSTETSSTQPIIGTPAPNVPSPYSPQPQISKPPSSINPPFPARPNMNSRSSKPERRPMMPGVSLVPDQAP